MAREKHCDTNFAELSRNEAILQYLDSCFAQGSILQLCVFCYEVYKPGIFETF